MASRTAWVAGLGQGLTWGTAINSADMASMTNGQTVVSSVADIANGTNLDILADLSFQLVIASSTIAAGANFTFWIYPLDQDGSKYGDGQFTNGTAASLTPSLTSCGYCQIPAVASTTNMYGYYQGIVLPPGSFRFAMQNNSGFSLTSGTQTVKYKTYNTNLNS
jgi:hypothetical protein